MLKHTRLYITILIIVFVSGCGNEAHVSEKRDITPEEAKMIQTFQSLPFTNNVTFGQVVEGYRYTDAVDWSVDLVNGGKVKIKMKDNLYESFYVDNRSRDEDDEVFKLRQDLLANTENVSMIVTVGNNIFMDISFSLRKSVDKQLKDFLNNISNSKTNPEKFFDIEKVGSSSGVVHYSRKITDEQQIDEVLQTMLRNEPFEWFEYEKILQLSLMNRLFGE